MSRCGLQYITDAQASPGDHPVSGNQPPSDSIPSKPHHLDMSQNSVSHASLLSRALILLSSNSRDSTNASQVSAESAGVFSSATVSSIATMEQESAQDADTKRACALLARALVHQGKGAREQAKDVHIDRRLQ